MQTPSKTPSHFSQNFIISLHLFLYGSIMNTTYTQLLGQLESLGFSSLEAKIYMALLAAGKMSAYQLAKKIDISRPSIYNAIEHMVGKGMIDYVPEKTPLYVAKEPSLLFCKLKQNMERSLDSSHMPSRFMMAEYESTSLVAGVSSRFDEWKGVVNNPPLNVSIICEHIHNDIYMLNWRNIYGKVLYEQNKIGSQFEANNTLKDRRTL